MDNPVFIGLDLARPGNDETVMWVSGTPITATEVEARLREYQPRAIGMHRAMQQSVGDLFAIMLAIKVPLIRYNKRKPRYRRMFPAMPKVLIDVARS